MSNTQSSNIETTIVAERIQVEESIPAHSRDLYFVSGRAETVKDLSSIGPKEIEFYRENGYLAVEEALSQAEVSGAIEEIINLITERSDFKRIGFELNYEAGVKDKIQTLDKQQRINAVRKIAGYVDYSPFLKGLAEKPILLNVLEKIIGEPSKLYANQAMIKPAKIGREKPWHQDHAYFNVPLGTPAIGVWIALDPATEENGCMHLLPGWHKKGPILHFKRRDWQICDAEIMGIPCISAPLKPGGLLFFDALLPHGTPTNNSDQKRWAMQLHYIPQTAKAISVPERLAIFGSEGKDVYC